MAMMRRRGLALVLALVLALSLLPANVLASEEEIMESVEAEVGDELTLDPGVDMEEVDGYWYSSDESVVLVDRYTGEIQVVGEGEAYVYFEYFEIEEQEELIPLKEAVEIPEASEATDVEESETEATDVEESETEATDVEESETEATDVEESETETTDVEESETETTDVEESETETTDVEESETETTDVEESETETIDVEKTESESVTIEAMNTSFSDGPETQVVTFKIIAKAPESGNVEDYLIISSDDFGKGTLTNKALEIYVVDQTGNQIAYQKYDIDDTQKIVVNVVPQNGYQIVNSSPALSNGSVTIDYGADLGWGGEAVRTLTVTVTENTATEYDVTFIWNVKPPLPNAGTDLSDTMYDTVTVLAEDACLGEQMPADPVYYSREFQGWNTSANGDGQVVTADTPITQDMTLYGQWGSLNLVTEYHIMGLTDLKRVIADQQGLDSMDFEVKHVQVTDGNATTTDLAGSNYYNREEDCWTALNANDIVWAEKVSGLVATIVLDGQEQEVMIPASQFASITRYGHVAEIVLDVPAYEDAVVTFWYQPGAGILWEEYDTRTVKVGESLGSNMPAEPEYPLSTYKFQFWSTEKEFGTEFTANTIVTGDMNVYARKSTQDTGASQYHVIGDEAIYEKVAAAYLKENPDADITANDVIISKMSMVGENGATNENYNGLVDANKWHDYDGQKNYYYYIHNLDAAATLITESNTRVPVNEIVGLKLFCTVNGEEYVCMVSREDLNLTLKIDAIVEVQVMLDQYTVTFKDGTEDYAVQSVQEGGRAVLPAEPSKEGASFKGWFLADGTEFDFNTRIYKDTVLYAKWETSTQPGDVTITLSYDANAGGDTTVAGMPVADSKTVQEGQRASFTVSTQKPTREGYTFLGWAVAPTSGWSCKGGESVSLAEDMTLYAVWQKNGQEQPGDVTITLSYDANAGDDTVTGMPLAEEKTVKEGENATFTIAAAEPTRKGYTFLGWASSSSAATAEYEADDTISVGTDTILYAVWKDDTVIPPKETVTLSFQYVTDVHNASRVPSGVTEPEDQDVELGSTFGSHGYGTGSYSSRYTFHGWYADADCTDRMSSSDIIDDDMTVYGYWTVRDRDDDDDDDDNGGTNIPDEDTPTTDLPDEGTPATDIPDEGTPTTDLPDEDVPMAEAPKTGDNMTAWILAAGVSGLGLVWLAISNKKRSENEAK